MRRCQPKYVIRRWPNPQLGFGRGVHQCVGAPLSRMLIRVTLEAVAERYRTLNIVGGFSYAESYFFRTTQDLRVSLED